MRSIMATSAAPQTPPAASLPVCPPGETTGRTFAVVLGEGVAAAAPAPAAGASAGRPSPVATALARLADGQRGVDRLLDAAARGRTFTPAQLLALQATVSRDAQTVEVVSRVADRVVGAVKQALGAQI